MEAASSFETPVMENFYITLKFESVGSFETSIERRIPEDCAPNNCVRLKSRKAGVLLIFHVQSV